VIGRYLRDLNCTITITTNDLELPWELMWHRGKFLCLERPVARIPIGRAVPREPYQLRQGSRAPRFLFVYADPEGNLPAARREVAQIRQRLEEEWRGQVETTFMDNPAGVDLTKTLPRGDYDVIHFAGHAAFDQETPERSGLQLKDEIFYGGKIRRLLEGQPLVFLNACESGRTANEEEPQSIHQYFHAPAAGLASAFVYGGAPACVGALWPIYDEPAADFAVVFYRHLLEGYTMGEAVRRSRLASREKYPDSITWAAFVLYGDPMHRI
jgi:CHAT domain-containing protein